MKSYQLIGELDCSKDLNKEMAIKYDAGKVRSEKYGEATLSGHILLLTRHGEFPPVHLKPVEEKATEWLNEMRLEEYHEDIFVKINIPSLIAITVPDVDPQKQEFYFKTMVFGFLFDDGIVKLNCQNKSNPIKLLQDIIKISEGLISIINSRGSDPPLEAAVSESNPIFKTTCAALSLLCRYTSKMMDENGFKRFARELMDFIRVNRWVLEYHNSSYSENDYFFLRPIDVGMGLLVESIYFARDIHICNEVRMHPLFRRYVENAAMHISLVNDILSLPKETANNETENFVFFKCTKYTFQKSIQKTENAINELVTELRVNRIRLESYFPSDHNLKNFIKAIELLVDGFIYWHQVATRYGSIKYEKYVVEYSCNSKSKLERIREMHGGNMIEPVLSE